MPTPSPYSIEVDALIHARWVATVDDNDKILENHTVAIQDQRIEAIIPHEDARQRYFSNNEVTLNDHLLIPGLINTHGHAAMTLMRGFGDDLPLTQWLQDHIWPAESQWVSEEFVNDGSEIAIAEMLRSGTTCFSDMYFFPNATARQADKAGIRAQIAFPVLETATAWGTGPDEYISKGLELCDQYRQSQTINACFGPHATYTVAKNTLERIAMLSNELSVGVHIHAHETADEVTSFVKEHGVRPLQRLQETGLLSPRLQIAHMVHANDDDLSLIQQNGSHVLHCPTSNLKLASGICPSQKMLELGINVALGTDGCASNNSLNLLNDMQHAALIAKVASNNAAAVPAKQALRMATINGAKALGLDQNIGSLEAGKFADIAAVKFDDIESQPLYDPLSQLVYTPSGHRVSHVWIGGEMKLKNRELSNISINALIDKAKYWHNKLSN